MIIFDLRCREAHVFEAWFGSSAVFEEQRAGGLLTCPICGDGEIEKAAMAPNVAAKGNGRNVPAAQPRSDPAPSPEALKAALHMLAKLQKHALEKSQWVGRAFADTARAMHDGDRPAAPIHGETTLAEAKSLVEDGVPIAALPLPIVPPDAIN